MSVERANLTDTLQRALERIDDRSTRMLVRGNITAALGLVSVITQTAQQILNTHTPDKWDGVFCEQCSGSENTAELHPCPTYDAARVILDACQPTPREGS